MRSGPLKRPRPVTSDCPKCGDASEDIGNRSFRCVGTDEHEFTLDACRVCKTGTIILIYGRKTCSNDDCPNYPRLSTRTKRK